MKKEYKNNTELTKDLVALMSKIINDSPLSNDANKILDFELEIRSKAYSILNRMSVKQISQFSESFSHQYHL